MKVVNIILLVFLLIRIFIGQEIIHTPWYIDAAVTIYVISQVFIHYQKIMGVLDNRRARIVAQPQFKGNPRFKLMPDYEIDLHRNQIATTNASEFLWASRLSVVELKPAIWDFGLASLCMVLAMVLLVVKPTLGITTPAVDFTKFLHQYLPNLLGPDDQAKINSTTLDVNWWWLPFSAGVWFYFRCLETWQIWKWGRHLNLTDTDFFDQKEQTILYPEGTSGDNPIPTEQIVDVDCVVSGNANFWSRWKWFPDGRFGTLIYKWRAFDSQDQIDTVTIDNVPHVEILARLLRQVSRASGRRRTQRSRVPAEQASETIPAQAGPDPQSASSTGQITGDTLGMPTIERE